MPLVHITLTKGKPDATIAAIAGGIHAAMVSTITVPDDDHFQIISEMEPGRLIADPQFLGISRSPDVIIVQITLLAGRSIAEKEALYRAIAANLEKDPGVRPEDIMVVLRENGPADWSFGCGTAQFAGKSYLEVEKSRSTGS